jgi:hypothetical protein
VIELVPLLVHMGAWGRRHLPATREMSVRQELLEQGGPKLWDEFMAELRALHLGAPATSGQQSVLERLTQAYQKALREPV